MQIKNETEKVPNDVQGESETPDEEQLQLKSPKKVAYASLILGVLGILFVPLAALFSIVLGYLSLSEQYEKTYRVQAKTGIILGYIHVSILLVLSILLISAKVIMDSF